MTRLCQRKNRTYYKMEFCMKALNAGGLFMRCSHPEGVHTLALKDLGAGRSRHPTGSSQAPDVRVTGLSVGVCWCHRGHPQGTSQYMRLVELGFRLS